MIFRRMTIDLLYFQIGGMQEGSIGKWLFNSLLSNKQLVGALLLQAPFKNFPSRRHLIWFP